jgi:hypothetical protein
MAPTTTLAERIPETAASDGDGGGNSSPPGDPDGEGAAMKDGSRRSNKKNSDRRDSQIPST